MFVCYVNQTENWFDILACVRGWGGGGEVHQDNTLRLGLGVALRAMFEAG